MEGRVGLVYDTRMCAHANIQDSNHPETPERLPAIFAALESAGVVQRCVRVDARDATIQELASVHTEKHITLMRAVSSPGFGKEKRIAFARKYNSVFFNEGSSKSALLAAGSVVEMVMRVAKGDLKAGAAIVRPPGHHAEADAAMGFCLFNNVAIAAHVIVHGKPALGVQKVLIVDWDVHHGNGTQHMFWKDPQVLYFSVHRYDYGMFYPGGIDGHHDKVGEELGAGFNINVPWPHQGFGDADYLAVWDNILMPIAHQFKPDLVLVSGGFDSAKGDPLGGCQVTPMGYSNMTHKLMGLAGGRVVLVLEGGYNLQSIADSYLACVKVMLGDQPEMIQNMKPALTATMPLIEELRNELQPFWAVLSLEDVLNAELKQADQPGEHKFDDSTEIQREDAERLTDVPVGPLDVLHLLGSLSGLSVDGVQSTPGIVETSNRVLASEATTGAPTRSSSSVAQNMPPEGRRPSAKSGEKERKPAGEIADCYEVTENPVKLSNQIMMTLPSSCVCEDSERSYVWYACYGSNMWSSRFLCYLNGGQVEGMASSCVGARNQMAPISSDWIMVPHDMFFGHTWTDTWGPGGVCFLDPTAHCGAPSTWLRIYKITLRQLNDIVIQENLGDPKNFSALVKSTDIDLLKREFSEAPGQTLELMKGAWYGALKYLGEKEGTPIVTITCSVTDMEKFRSGQLPVCRPSEAYRKAITRGLVEHDLLSEKDVEEYLSLKIEALQTEPRSEM